MVEMEILTIQIPFET